MTGRRRSSVGLSQVESEEPFSPASLRCSAIEEAEMGNCEDWQSPKRSVLPWSARGNCYGAAYGILHTRQLAMDVERCFIVPILRHHLVSSTDGTDTAITRLLTICLRGVHHFSRERALIRDS